MMTLSREVDHAFEDHATDPTRADVESFLCQAGRRLPPYVAAQVKKALDAQAPGAPSAVGWSATSP